MKKKDLFYIIVLIFISGISRVDWLKSSSIIVDGDWAYWYPNTVVELFNNIGVWSTFDNLGGVTTQLPFSIFMYVWTIIAKIGFNHQVGVQLTFLIPIIILSVLSPYLLSKYLNNGKYSEFLAFVVAIFYSSTTYGIVNIFPIQFVYVLSPLIILYFLKTINSNKKQDYILFSILYTLGIIYEIRLMFLITLILLIYFIINFIFEKKIEKFFLKFFLIFIIGVLLNVFWFVPLIFSGGSYAIGEIVSRPLFGDNLFNISQSITMYMWNWTGSAQNIVFIPQPILWYFWINPIILVLLMIIVNKTQCNDKKYYIFFIITLLFGVFFSKQSGAPLGGVYKWFYESVFGFNLFREASKFYLVLSVAYLGLYIICLKLFIQKFSNKYIIYLIGLIIVATNIVNYKPLFTREIGSVVVSQKEVETKYILLDKYIRNDNDYFFRVLWSDSLKIWSPSYTKRPRVLYSFFNNIRDKTSFDENELLNRIGVKYIVVEEEDKNLMDIVSTLNLKKVEQYDNIHLYLNLDYYPKIYFKNNDNIQLDKIIFEQISAHKYKLRIKELKNSIDLQFIEQYNSNWILYQDRNKTDSLFITKDNGLYEHEVDILGNNIFKINYQYIKQNSDTFIYKENPDGSIDIELTLYFKTQSYFYLGIIISGTTLILCLGYLGYSFYRKRGGKLSPHPAPPKQGMGGTTLASSQGGLKSEVQNTIHPRLAGTPTPK